MFSTKERAPFYICLEIFRPEEEDEKDLIAKHIDLAKEMKLDKAYFWSYDVKLSQAQTV